MVTLIHPQIESDPIFVESQYFRLKQGIKDCQNIIHDYFSRSQLQSDTVPGGAEANGDQGWPKLCLHPDQCDP